MGLRHVCPLAPSRRLNYDMCARCPSPFPAAVHPEEGTSNTLAWLSHQPLLCTLFCGDRGGTCSCSMGATQEDAAAAAAAAVAVEEASSTTQTTQSFKGCSSSMEKFYPIDSPLKKRKSQHELIDPRQLSLKYKFRKRLSQQEDESATTESLGCDSFFINQNCCTDMVSIPEEVDSCENTLSLFGGCIEVDSKNGIESQSMKKMFEVRASGSSISSNIFSTDGSSSHSTGTKETDSWIMPDDDWDRMYDVLQQYGDLMDGELASGDVLGSASHIMDEKLYSNGVHDLLPTGQTDSPGVDTNRCVAMSVSKQSDVKKLTIDQEFEQYFSRLML